MKAEEIVQMIHENANDNICLDLSARAVKTLSNHLKFLSIDRQTIDKGLQMENDANFVFDIKD